MGYDEAGAAASQFRQRLLDGSLDFAAEGTRRLIEDQDPRTLEEHAGDRDALRLPT